MEIPRNGIAAAAWDGHIYVTGTLHRTAVLSDKFALFWSHAVKGNHHCPQNVGSRARPIRFFGPIPIFFNFHCRYLMPIPIFLYYSSSIYFASWGKITTPGPVLPSAKHFQTTAERQYSSCFSSGHINKQSNFTSYIYFMRQDIHSCFALWGKIYAPGAIFPPAQHDWLKWSHDKFGLLDCLGCLWHL